MVGYFFIMRIAILGFSLEGKAILKYLQKSPQYKNAEIWILDRDSKLQIHPNVPNNIRIKKGKNYLKNLDEFDIIFRSPGIPYNLPEIQSAIKNGVQFSSSTKIFFEEAKKIGCQIIGITGTKGKGTTSTLLYKIIKANGKEVFLAGNIGKPAIEILPKLSKKSIVILELSSFQLQDLKRSPNITIILNIFEDHLDSHKSFKEYVLSKANIAKWQTKTDKIFYDADNKWSRLLAQKSKGEKIPISISNFKLFKQGDLKMAGEHNFKNAVIAATIAKNIGINENIIKKTTEDFRGLEHRLEFVRQIKNIKFYNDSASTNPYTAIAAIKAFSEPKILICGGKDKNLDYSPLAKVLKRSNTKLIILFGENKNKIKQSIIKCGIPIKSVKNLETSIESTYQTAKKPINRLANQPITIIFSPASASFDMFVNYKDRGKKFKKLVKKLK